MDNISGPFGSKEGILSPYVLLPGEKATPFLEYVMSIGGDIMTNKRPKGQKLKAGAQSPGMLIPAAQEVFFNVTNMVIDTFESGYCFEVLDESIIYITEHFHSARLLVNNLQQRTDAGVQKNLASLGAMLHKVVVKASPLYAANKKVNPDFTDVLGVLKNYQTEDDFFVITFPACYCPLGNRGHLAVSMYDFTMHVLRFADPEAYTHVIASLDYPVDWYLGIPDNTYLTKQYNQGEYDPLAKRKGTDPRLELPRLQRNDSAHTYEGTFDTNEPHGMKWTKQNSNHAFYYLSPKLISSMQLALSYLGELQHLDTELLFGYWLQKKMVSK